MLVYESVGRTMSKSKRFQIQISPQLYRICGRYKFEVRTDYCIFYIWTECQPAIVCVRLRSNTKIEYKVLTRSDKCIFIPERNMHLAPSEYLTDQEKLELLNLPSTKKADYLQEQYKSKTKVFLKKAITEIKQIRKRTERYMEADAERRKQNYISSKKREIFFYDKDIAKLEKRLGLQ